MIWFVDCELWSVRGKYPTPWYIYLALYSNSGTSLQVFQPLCAVLFLLGEFLRLQRPFYWKYQLKLSWACSSPFLFAYSAWPSADFCLWTPDGWYLHRRLRWRQAFSLLSPACLLLSGEWGNSWRFFPASTNFRCAPARLVTLVQHLSQHIASVDYKQSR